jgi:hypothetical protein
MKPDRERRGGGGSNDWVNYSKCLVSCMGELSGSDYSGVQGKICWNTRDRMLYAVLRNRGQSWSRIRTCVDGNLWKKVVNQFRSP